MRRKRIRTLEDLWQAAQDKRAVVVDPPYRWVYKPAAFLMSLQGNLLVTLFRAGIYLYEPKKKHGAKGA